MKSQERTVGGFECFEMCLFDIRELPLAKCESLICIEVNRALYKAQYDIVCRHHPTSPALQSQMFRSCWESTTTTLLERLTAYYGSG